jgi:radical SAM superfamily enzyme YgiQ (UPF0313 family)
MKLGLLAMSGVRCRNEELLAMGLTLPGFVERSKVIASLPSLGLLTLAGMTPAEVDVSYLDVPEPRSFEVPERGSSAKLPGDFDVVAISSFTAQIKEAYHLADRYRAAGVKVLMGGLHVTARPEEALQHADSVLLGEGESLWPTMIADLLANRLQQRYDARALNFDFAHSPMPRFELLDIDKYNRLTVQTQRGCPFNCDFCGASIRLNPRFKAKPVSRVIDEIHRIKAIWPHPFLEFADDNTFADKARGRELVRALVPEGLRWFTETDVSIARDPELLAMMKDAGCAQILIGLESPTAAGLDGLEQKANWKLKQRENYLRAIETIQDAGITVNGCFVLGLDGQDETSFDAVFDFVRASGLYEVQITVMTAFPNAPLYDRLRTSGRLLDAEAWESCTLFDVNYVPEKMSVTALEAGFRQLAGRIYDTAFIEERRRRFFKRQSRLRKAAALGAKAKRAPVWTET